MKSIRRMSISFQLVGMALVLSMLGIAPTAAQVRPIPIHELADSMRLYPKPALILISTDWCTYCAMQKAQLKKNSRFTEAAAHFHFSELDAESKEPVTLNGRTYHFEATGTATGTHQLAQALGTVGNRLAFPTWVLISEKFELLLQYPGVLGPEALQTLADILAKTTEKQ